MKKDMGLPNEVPILRLRGYFDLKPYLYCSFFVNSSKKLLSYLRFCCCWRCFCLLVPLHYYGPIAVANFRCRHPFSRWCNFYFWCNFSWCSPCCLLMFFLILASLVIQIFMASLLLLMMMFQCQCVASFTTFTGFLVAASVFCCCWVILCCWCPYCCLPVIDAFSVVCGWRPWCYRRPKMIFWCFPYFRLAFLLCWGPCYCCQPCCTNVDAAAGGVSGVATFSDVPVVD